jgi:hypothetical protein
MSRKNVTGGRRSRRSLTWVWIIATVAVIFGLLYWEQTAILYVLGTLGVSGLLLVVAMSDLSGAHRIAADLKPAVADDSAALGSGIREASAAPKTTFGARPKKKRRS